MRLLGLLHDLQRKAIVLCCRDVAVRLGAARDLAHLDDAIDDVDGIGVVKGRRRVKLHFAAHVGGIQHLADQRCEDGGQFALGGKGHLRVILGG